jgi:hypothetical protein
MLFETRTFIISSRSCLDNMLAIRRTALTLSRNKQRLKRLSRTSFYNHLSRAAHLDAVPPAEGCLRTPAAEAPAEVAGAASVGGVLQAVAHTPGEDMQARPAAAGGEASACKGAPGAHTEAAGAEGRSAPAAAGAVEGQGAAGGRWQAAVAACTQGGENSLAAAAAGPVAGGVPGPEAGWGPEGGADTGEGAARAAEGGRTALMAEGQAQGQGRGLAARPGKKERESFNDRPFDLHSLDHTIAIAVGGHIGQNRVPQLPLLANWQNM